MFCYQVFDKTNKTYNSDPSKKQKFIKENYFTKPTSSVPKKSTIPKEPNYLHRKKSENV